MRRAVWTWLPALAALAALSPAGAQQDHRAHDHSAHGHGMEHSHQAPSGQQQQQEKRLEPLVVCYVSSWAIYRPGDGAFEPRHMDPSLCSHIVYAFAGLRPDNNSIVPLDRWNDLEEGGGKGSFRKYTQLRQRKPSLKVTLAVGGWNEGSGNYSHMAADPQRRRRFVESAVNIIREHDFDGLDLDWEYPTKRGGAPHDRANFVALVQELRAAFDEAGGGERGRWLLTSAISAAPDTAAAAYDLPALARHLDYMHVMAYDYHGQWDARVGVHAPLRAPDAHDALSVEKTLDFLLSAGAPPEKLVLGLPFYGRTFTAKGPAEASFGAETDGQGMAGPFSREKGFMGFNEICAELEANGTQWRQGWDERSSTPFAVRGRDFISYDDPRSLDLKVRYGVRRGAAGAMVWAAETDDFRGACARTTGHGAFPLLRAVNKALREALEERENELQEARRRKEHEQGGGGGGGALAPAPAALAALAAAALALLPSLT